MQNSIKILILDDLPTDAELIKRELKRSNLNFVSEYAQDKTSFVEKLENFQPDVILSDYMMPQFTGLEAMEIAKEHDPHLPVIIITGSINEETAVRCMKEGADDYIIKEYLKRLDSAVTRAVEKRKLSLENERANAELKKSEAKFREIIESTKDIHYRQEFKTAKWDYISPSFTDTFGYAVEEVIDWDMEQQERFIHHDDFPEMIHFRDDMLAAKETGKNYLERQFRILDKDGNIHWIHGSYFLTEDDDGEPEYVVGVLRDITESKRIEEALRESENKLAGIINSIPDFMTIIDRDYRILWANNAAKDTYGEDIVGKKCFQAYHRKADPCEKCLVDKVFATEKTHQQTSETIDKNDKTIHQLSIASVSSRYPDGTPKTAIEVSRDITKYKQLEAQFRQAQKMEAIGRLAGGVAHDFNNHLTIISGNASLAKDTLYEDDPISADLQEILDATDRAAKLTQQLLAFSRKQEIEPRVMNMNDIVNNLKKMLSRLIGENIRLETNLADDLWNVMIDDGQFGQVIVNICVNAKDAMENGGSLQIQTRNIVINDNYIDSQTKIPKGVYALLTISDTGFGMSEEVMSQIFEPFYTTKAVGEGTGLGLSTVYGIVTQNNGYITVYSEPGFGTTFNIYIPKTTSVEKIEEQKLSSESMRGNETVMIVEDEPGVRKVAVKTLRDYGYDVIEAENGGTGFLKCKNATKKIDLIVTDIIMPQLDGTEFIDSIREYIPGVKVLYMSGYTFDVMAKKGLIPSETNFMNKPFKPNQLLKKVRQVLDSSLVNQSVQE